MTDRILVLGDAPTTPLLDAEPDFVTVEDLVGSARADPRTIAQFAALPSRPTRAMVKRALQDHVFDAVRAARQHPRVRHIVVIVVADAELPPYFDRIASAVATRAHAELERVSGRDIELTVLDASECPRANLLINRIRLRSADPAGTHGVVVLRWEDISTQDIAQAAREQYL
ncbi:hypothetical protein [Microbacterium binotii]|uniref:hypothetical protein n=1 Tax=Microbacterium binotii TaxID=462710 RepID=UPI001F207D81|nr:hypothetical protein [Microbacterium binotii]UIN30971.1 hypothetical protein LXM64_01815 [Microbacterium binotii]